LRLVDFDLIGASGEELGRWQMAGAGRRRHQGCA
jgi:hypothetical protein